MSEDLKTRAEMHINFARNLGKARRAEQDRIAAKLETLLWDAKEQETIDSLVSLARHIFA